MMFVIWIYKIVALCYFFFLDQKLKIIFHHTRLFKVAILAILSNSEQLPKPNLQAYCHHTKLLLYYSFLEHTVSQFFHKSTNLDAVQRRLRCHKTVSVKLKLWMNNVILSLPENISRNNSGSGGKATDIAHRVRTAAVQWCKEERKRPQSGSLHSCTSQSL